MLTTEDLTRNLATQYLSGSADINMLGCYYPAGRNFHWNLYFAISLVANSLNLNYAYYYDFRNLSVIAYMIEIRKSKFANVVFFMNLTNLRHAAKLNSLYIFIL